MSVLAKLLLTLISMASAFRSIVRSRTRSSSLLAGADVAAELGGKVVVTGIGEVDEDEFMLTLLNEQVLVFPLPL